jgi:hypothetical protein
LQTFPPNQNAIARGGITRPPDHERFAWSVVWLVAAAVLGTVATLCAQDARSFWSRLPVDGEVIVTTRWPLPERCQAAATKTTLFVADPSGSLLWQWPFRDTNRFIHVTHNSTVALSPDCQHAILAGNVDYTRTSGRWLAMVARASFGPSVRPCSRHSVSMERRSGWSPAHGADTYWLQC